MFCKCLDLSTSFACHTSSEQFHMALFTVEIAHALAVCCVCVFETSLKYNCQKKEIKLAS